MDDHQPGRRCRAARAVRRRRVPRGAPAAAVPDLRQPDPRRELRGDGAAAGGDVRDVLLPEPVHPERDGLQPAQDRRRVPAVQRRHRDQRGHRVQPGQPHRRPLHRRRRHAGRRGRALRVLPARRARQRQQRRAGRAERAVPRCRRQLLDPGPAVHRADGARHGRGVRAADPDRGAPRARRGLRHRLGRAQHHAAGRRRPRPGDPGHRGEPTLDRAHRGDRAGRRPRASSRPTRACSSS